MKHTHPAMTESTRIAHCTDFIRAMVVVLGNCKLVFIIGRYPLYSYCYRRVAIGYIAIGCIAIGYIAMVYSYRVYSRKIFSYRYRSYRYCTR